MHVSPLLILAACTYFASAFQRSVSHDGAQLVRIPSTPMIRKTADALALDVWGKKEASMDVLVTPEQKKMLEKVIPGNVVVLQKDIQSKIDAETERLTYEEEVGSTEEADGDPFEAYFTEYHRYEDITRFLHTLQDHYPSLITIQDTIGKSVEGRDTPLMRITSPKGNRAEKKRIWIQGMQHAREWISGATVQYLAYTLVSTYGKDPRVTSLLDTMEFVMVPMSNPDGYVYTWDGDRLWRKNRAVVGGHKLGVDTNRNWPEHWGGEGASSNPNSQTYAGPYPTSEPEVRNLMAAFKSTPNVIGAIDMHSYSQLLLRPYGFTQTPTPDEAKFVELTQKMKTAIQSVAGTVYVPKRGMDLYAVNGGARDWFYNNATQAGEKKKYGITIELSPSEDDPEDYGMSNVLNDDVMTRVGFILPPQKILPVGKEVSQAIWTFAEYVYEHQLGVKGPVVDGVESTPRPARRG